MTEWMVAGRVGMLVGGQAGDGGDRLAEGLEELLIGDVEDIGAEALAAIVDLLNAHTVGEGRDVQQVEQGRLGSTDLGTGLNELEVGDNLNGTTSNLGGDTKSLEEGGLTGLHTGVTSGNPDVTGSESTGTGGGSDTVGKDLLLDSGQVAVGENETNVALDVGHQALELGVLNNETLESTADHGVLSHQDDTLSTEGDTDLVHLLGRHIVDTDNEDGAVLIEKGLELIKVSSLGSGTAPHFFLLL